MPQTDIGSTVASSLETVQLDYSVAHETTDAHSEAGETRWENERWAQYLGYYKKIPELKIAIDAIAKWSVGKGYQADEVTTLILDNIIGFGEDTFNSILSNAIRTYKIGGDFFAEVITNKEGFLINLKPLDPEVMVIVVDNKGLIKRYEQISKVKGKATRKFEPEDIFHLPANRIADEIHGISAIEAVEEIILMRNESMADMRKLMHRHVKPMRVWHLDTDNATEIADFKTTTDLATEQSENLYIPKGTVEHELVAVAANATLNPLAWIQFLNTIFFQTMGVPEIVVGGTGAFTDAAAKTAYLAWEQTVSTEQLFIEEEVLKQLNLVIKLEFPASLQQGALSGKENEEGVQANPPQAETVQPTGEPNDTTAELEGRK